MVYLLFSRPPTSGRKPIWHQIMGERRLSARNNAKVVVKVISVAFEVTNFGYRRGKICRERAISVMSRLAPIYTIYGLLPAIFGSEAKSGEPTRASRPIELTQARWQSGKAELRGTSGRRLACLSIICALSVSGLSVRDNPFAIRGNCYVASPQYKEARWSV
jgi:hypothetical protein